MAEEITSNPNPAEPIVDKEGLPTQQQIDWNDEIELFSRQVSNEIHSPDVFTVATLPDVTENAGRKVYVLGLFGASAPQDTPVPCWAAVPFPYGQTRTLTSVSNLAGGAQFNMVGGEGNIVHAGEKVLVSGYSPSSGYNGIHTASSNSGDGFFQVTSLPFTESGGGGYRVLGNWRSEIDGTIVA